VVYTVGDRNQRNCQKSSASFSENYSNATGCSDFWLVWQTIIAEDQPQAIGRDGKRNHVESWNHTRRQHLEQLVRKRLSLSKELESPRISRKPLIMGYHL